jgi:hypothetical protein
VTSPPPPPSPPPSSPPGAARDVQSWLRAARDAGAAATLCTALPADDAHAPGFPFGSLVPFELDDANHVSIVISDLAVHTKNLRKDPRAALVVAEPGGDPQAGWRVTLVGSMRELPGEARPDLPGFRRFVLDVRATRYIAGFGRMGWL